MTAAERNPEDDPVLADTWAEPVPCPGSGLVVPTEGLQPCPECGVDTDTERCVDVDDAATYYRYDALIDHSLPDGWEET